MSATADFTISEPPPDDDAIIARLAKLLPLEYERVRAAEAEALGCRAAILDRLVATARPKRAEEGEGQGRALHIERPEPWPAPIDGAELLADLAGFVGQHVFLPPGAADAIAAWCLHTYIYQAFRHSPRLAIVSPEKRCGKTVLLDTLALLVCSPLSTANISAAALFRTIELAKPTLLIDEGDSFLNDNEPLRNVLNAGHQRGKPVIRTVGEDFEPREFAVFAPAAIAAIGRLGRLGTLEDRSVVVHMVRATRAERPKPIDDDAEAEAAALARRCERWASDHAEELARAKPRLPAALFNRSADNWRPLFAIAEVVGSGWWARLESASAGLLPEDDAEGLGVRLLADLRTLFAERNADRLPSEAICSALAAMDGAPWAEANHGRPISPTMLARLLVVSCLVV